MTNQVGRCEQRNVWAVNRDVLQAFLSPLAQPFQYESFGLEVSHTFKNSLVPRTAKVYDDRDYSSRLNVPRLAQLRPEGSEQSRLVAGDASSAPRSNSL